MNHIVPEVYRWSIHISVRSSRFPTITGGLCNTHASLASSSFSPNGHARTQPMKAGPRGSAMLATCTFITALHAKVRYLTESLPYDSAHGLSKANQFLWISVCPSLACSHMSVPGTNAV